MARKRNGNGHKAHDATGMMRWLLTYADLITLLMIFFVIMYAMSKIDAEKYQKLASSLQRAFHIEGGAGTSIITLNQMNTLAPESIRAREDAEFRNVIARIKAQAQDNNIIFFIDERGLTISFLDSVLFDLGRAELRPDALKILAAVGSVLKDIPNIIRVEGHTDDLPIATVQYPSNWELSAARAINVTRYMINTYNINPKRMSATGYGEYRPQYPNNSEENRKKNRRVDIVVLRSSLVIQER